MFSMPTANRPDFTTRATNCALLTISVVCVCVLVVCGVMIVREYALAKGYHASSCRIANIDYSPNDIACMFCGPGPKSATKEKGSGACKHSRFPCVRIKVNFTMDGHQREGLLHPDSLQAASPYAQVDMVTKLHTYWFKIQRTRNMGNESVVREGGWGDEWMGL